MYGKIKIFILFSLLTLVILLLLGKLLFMPTFIQPLKNQGFLKSDSLKIDAKKRDFYLYHPNNSSVPDKLILAFHPATENGNYMRMISGYTLDSIADAENIFICYPNAYYGYWNDKLSEVITKASTENVDEVSFVRGIIHSIETNYNTKLKYIYLLGLSQGGAMVYRLCLEIPDEITAATVVAANLSVKKTLDMDSVKKPVSMLIINGVKDPICPYLGGEINILHLIKRGYVYSAKTTVTYWANCAGYNSPTSTDSLVNEEKEKIASVINYEEKGKKNICLYSVMEGGHTLPHPAVNSPKVFGKTVHDFNGTLLSWQFFKKNTLLTEN